MSEQLETRVALLEAEVARLKEALENVNNSGTQPWWKEHLGAFENDPDYDEAMRLGREYRESLRPSDEEEIAHLDSPLSEAPSLPQLKKTAS